MPVSYADMAKTNDKPKDKKSPNDKVPKEQQASEIAKCPVSNQIACDHNKTNSPDASPSVVKNTPPDVHNIKNFPAITKQVAAVVQVNVVVDKTKNSNKICRNTNANNKNVKNNVNKTAVCVVDHHNNIHNDYATLSDLNDGELKGLLDEALNYKNPKDREGKSKLFNHLLNEAEEDERNARAARAGGSELVRYCNPSAKRNSRHRKKPSSISENMMHGGSLDNLAKEELFETSKHRTKKSVSARQREGGKHYHKFSRVKTLIPSDRREPAVQRQRKHRHEPRVPVPGGGQEKEGDEREEERRRRRGAEIARTRLPRPELPRKIQRDPTVSV
jgi:hypothetical protein